MAKKYKHYINVCISTIYIYDKQHMVASFLETVDSRYPDSTYLE